jgi:hypothetical protein
MNVLELRDLSGPADRAGRGGLHGLSLSGLGLSVGREITAQIEPTHCYVPACPSHTSYIQKNNKCKKFGSEDELMFPTDRILNYASCSNYHLIYFRPLTAK